MSSQQNKKKVLDKLDIDSEYYGSFGKKWLSSSIIGKILAGDPLALYEKQEPKLAFVQGSYFHVAVLEPHKLDKFEISTAISRRSNEYKDEANGNILLLEKDVTRLNEMIQATLSDESAYPYIRNEEVEYEVPMIGEICGLPFKGKADIVNVTKNKVVDLKTTANIWTFKDKIDMWNYDSQAYIYEQLFDRPFVWVVVCKKTYQIDVVYNQDKYRRSGREKVERASEIYRSWFPDKFK